MIVDDATMAQIRAADPAASTWVSANAGSGKTRVLIDRVARLLLHGTDPQKVLCLTYTKAAAAEMQNRLFVRLGEWAMMPDNKLRDALLILGESESRLSTEKLRGARTLFANALETPGGLKIQTIHSFCDKLLRRFPLESQVSPQFEVLEDRQAKMLRMEVLEELADRKNTAAVDGLAEFVDGNDPDDLLREIVGNRVALMKPITYEMFGLTRSDSIEKLSGKLFDDNSIGLLTRAAGILELGKKTDQNIAKLIKNNILPEKSNSRLLSLEDGFLYKGSSISGPYTAKLGKIPTKELRNLNPELAAELDDYMPSVEAARTKRLSLLAHQRTKALAVFAKAFLEEYDRRKSALGRLDYDDLISKAAVLLSTSDSAQWVLFKLDGGIDHILVDEAQDTSPAQWDVISKLTEEFTSGNGAGATERTIFVVGDEKQSIYSFQGADPAEFSRMRDQFAIRMLNIERRLEQQNLLYSFRSAEPILRLVDLVFGAAAGDDFDGIIRHRPFVADMPGRVDLWPFMEKEEADEEPEWYEPLDMQAPNDPSLKLSQRLADWVQQVLNTKQILPGRFPHRRISAGDILILVQRRGPLFRAIIKELEMRDIPVAGADRLDVGSELAVRDILSLLKFADLPEDDLSLAEAMRSPILRLSEADLYTLSHGRKGTLWQSLRAHSDDYHSTLDVLWKLLNQTDYLRPFELIEMILTDFQGRSNLVARLGAEVEDGINELLAQALRYEQIEVPTLSGFLHWFESGKVEIKREMDRSANQIRVMTVHGAKGLEAPIVILPDTAKRQIQDRSQIVNLPSGSVAWKTDKANATKIQLQAQERRKLFEAQERKRLLYVALTRAETWLIICGAGNIGKDGESWYNMIEQAIVNAGAVETNLPCVGVVQSISHNWADDHDDGTAAEPALLKSIPDWAAHISPPAPRAPQNIAPSELGGAKTLPGENSEVKEEDALRRGRQVHLLLEHLPGVAKGQRLSVAQRLLVGDCNPTSTSELMSVLAETNQVLDNPDLGFIFAHDVLAEVGVTAELPELDGSRIDGVIDRLVISEESVLAVDFKTNSVVPELREATPIGVLRQLGAYAAALGQIYPDKEIMVSVLWTANGKLVTIPHDIVMHALQTPPTS